MEQNNAQILPTVSVVMPVYSVARYVEQAVDSVLQQSWRDFELLVIDDESPDNSIELVKLVTKGDPRVRIIRQENRGLAGARNTGIREAKGEFIAFLDSDDFWNPTKLQKHIELMRAQPQISVSFSASLFVNDQGASLNRVQSPRRKADFTAKDIFCRNPVGNGSAPVIRKSVLQQIRFRGLNKQAECVAYDQYFDESLKQSEDIDCWTRISITAGSEFALIDSPLTNYRVNTLGLSADVEAQFSTWMVFVDKLEKISPQFVAKNRPAAMAFQYRYLARRCITQGQAKQALGFMTKAIVTSPMALLSEWQRSFSTLIASLLLATLNSKGQMSLIRRMGVNL